MANKLHRSNKRYSALTGDHIHMRNSLARFCSALALLLLVSSGLHAQSVTAITGVVTDPTGAVIPGVSVTLQNALTNATYKATTNDIGSYSINNVAPGPGYRITFERDGFSQVVISDIYLNVSNTRTQNARLTVGGTSQTVQVSAVNDTVALNTSDATVGNNFDVSLVNDLPVYNRDTPAALFNLQPGITNNAVTGARTDQSSVTVDGLDVNDIATGQTYAIISRAPVDSIQEFRAEVAGDVSGVGTGGGGQFQLVTKSGTNHFHGNLNEYHRDTQLVANSWFNNNTKLPRTPLIRNQFGGNLGGPIRKDKLFFFFDFNNSRTVQSSSVARTVPLDSFRNGTVSYILNKDAAGNTCTASSRQNTTPQCIGTLSTAGVANLDPQHVGFNSNLKSFTTSRFPHANDLTGGDGINTGYYRFNTPTPIILYNYIGKIDYTMNSSMKIFGRFSIARQDSTQTVIQFAGDPMTHPFQDRSYSYVVGHNWTIGSNKVNQLTYGDVITKYNFATTYNPAGTSVFTYGGGTSAFTTAPYSSPSSQKRRVPVPQIKDDFSWIKGNHNLQFGGTFKFIKTHSNLVGDFNSVTIGLGGAALNLDSTVRPTDIRTAGTTAAFTYDNAFAFALGRVGAISSNYNYDNKGKVQPQGLGATRSYRFFETEAYFGDTWKVNPQLTLSYGVRYQLYSVPYETQGLQSVQNFTFDQYFGARVKQSAAGISGDSAVPFITYKLGGKANSGPNLYDPSYKDFSPRFAFAYSPASNKNLVIKGGGGIMFDRTVINAVNFIQDQSSYLFQNSASKQYGSATSAQTTLLNDPRLGANNAIPAPPTANAISIPYTPYVTNGTPHGLGDNEFNTAVDPSLKDPYSIVYNFGIEQELPEHFILKIGYVGRLGRRLIAQADASQLVDFPDKASNQLLSTAFANMVKEHRAGVPKASINVEPWFENQIGAGYTKAIYGSSFGTLIDTGDFADFIQGLGGGGYIDSNIGMASQLAENTYITNKGFSSYNGMLVTLNKNMSHGLKFDFNYTWSHSIDNVSAIANFIAASNGYGFLCDARNNRTCRGNSDFDAQNVITSDFIYELPFGRKRAFAATVPLWMDEVIGGWSLSGIPGWASGQALNTSTSAYVAGYANNAPATFIGSKPNVAAHPNKTSSGSVNLFTDPTKAQASFVGPIGFSIGNRNILRGPSTFTLDAGLAKTFPIYSDKVNLNFRADAYNVLNHPVFTTTTTDITSGSFGQMTATSIAARVMQLALRLEF